MLRQRPPAYPTEDPWTSPPGREPEPRPTSLFQDQRAYQDGLRAGMRGRDRWSIRALILGLMLGLGGGIWLTLTWTSLPGGAG